LKSGIDENNGDETLAVIINEMKIDENVVTVNEKKY